MLDEYKLFYCQECGHPVLSRRPPAPITWTDLHTCKDWALDPPQNLSKEEL